MTALLEIGSARTGPVHPSAVTMDVAGAADHQAVWGVDPIPLPDNSVGEIYTSHTLEHVPWFNTIAALKEALRVLRPGGLIEIWVPNFAYIVECYQKGECGDKWRKFNRHGDPVTWVNGRIFTYGPDEANWHRAVFDEGHLTRCLTQAGFTDIKRLPKRTRGQRHGPIDMGMTGRKS